MKLSEAVPQCLLQAPEPELIERAERDLGVAFPEQLRALYRECNGLREPLGHASYVWPLYGKTSLVRMTRFFWSDFKEIAPNAPELSGYVFFGSSTADLNWAISLGEPTRVIAYHHHMEGEFEIVGADIRDVFVQDQRFMREIADQ